MPQPFKTYGTLKIVPSHSQIVIDTKWLALVY